MNLTTSISFKPDLRAIAQMNTLSGPVGQGAKKAAEVTVKRSQGSVNAFGRVDTGYMRDSIHADFRGSNQHECRFSISSRAYYARFQHEGTRYIRPAPFLLNAINRLRPADFT